MADENLPFHRKYRPNTLARYIGNEKLKETAMKALQSGKRPQVILLWGDSGCGKAQPLDSLVLTTSGYKKMGDIKIGDEVFTHNGNRGKISGIYPQGVRPIYRITLRDRTYIDVSDEHLNLVWKCNNSEPEVVTTNDLLRLNISDYCIKRPTFNLNDLSLIKECNRGMSYDLDCYDYSIKSIEYIGEKECQCIMIDHPDHTYISDYFIPTHNTTFARLLAKEYSCEDRDEETGACGQCLSCQTIDEYIATGDTSTLASIKEVNIADQSGKRDLDSVLEDMMIPAFGDEWKIYIFDECHEASSGLQNKLLKIAEEPPEHVLMLFCTTNPEKMIDTLKNRCQLQLHVTKPKVKELAGLLRYVCECEQVDYDSKGLEFIANRGELTIRTALQNLQQVVNEQNNAKYDNAIQVFETVSNTLIIDLFRALKCKDILRYITLLYEIKSKMDLNAFLIELRNFIKRGIYTINGIQQDGVADSELKVYRDLFGDLGVAQICCLLNKIMSVDTKNLEMELITLGYIGFDDSQKSQDVDNIVIPTIENEIKLENKNADKVIKNREEISYNQGVENANSQMTGLTFEDILSMGGTLVE